jgi:hypothetical protein
MSDKKMMALEATLLLSGAALGATGAVLIQPLVIGAGVVAAGAGAIMRFNDRHVTPTVAPDYKNEYCE